MIQDTFTEASNTALGSHTPDSNPGGGGWNVATGAMTVGGGTGLVTADSGNLSRARLDIAPTDANYYAEVTGQPAGGGTSAERIGVQIRRNNGTEAGSDLECYETMQTGAGATTWFARSYDGAGTENQFASGSSGVAATTDRVLRIEHDGTNIIVTEDGTTTLVDAPNSDVTITGDTGIYLRGTGQITLLESDADAGGGGAVNLVPNIVQNYRNMGYLGG